MSEDDRITLAFARIAELGNRLGAGPLNKHPACWELQIDERWWIAVNGHHDMKKCSKGADVLPFHAWIEYNGWPAGMVNPRHGVIAAGAEANETTFIEALEKRIAQTP